MKEYFFVSVFALASFSSFAQSKYSYLNMVFTQGSGSDFYVDDSLEIQNHQYGTQNIKTIGKKALYAYPKREITSMVTINDDGSKTLSKLSLFQGQLSSIVVKDNKILQFSSCGENGCEHLTKASCDYALQALPQDLFSKLNQCSDLANKFSDIDVGMRKIDSALSDNDSVMGKEIAFVKNQKDLKFPKNIKDINLQRDDSDIVTEKRVALTYGAIEATSKERNSLIKNSWQLLRNLSIRKSMCDELVRNGAFPVETKVNSQDKGAAALPQ